MTEMNLPRDWDFSAGKLPLDFVNTINWRRGVKPEENLNDYADLVDWSRDAGLLSKDEVSNLLIAVKDHPMKAAKALVKAIELREAIYWILSNAAKGKPTRHKDLTQLNIILSEAGKRAQITPTPHGFGWAWDAEKVSFDRILWPIARSTAELLTSGELDRIGECADDRGCSWLFIDSSRNRSRRWCSMESCGNRAKARRHYKKITGK
jgi:predicted RNA-binding Zn ribbon-like protein